VKKDIVFPEMTGVMLAIARKPVDQDFHWHAYIINNNTYDLNNLLIVSKGYSQSEEPRRDTSILRHSIEVLKAQSYAVIEALDPAVFVLFNEFWVSFYHDNQVFDKKFIFTPGSILDDHLMNIEALDLEGVLHL
jgi:hypothetical protein